MKKSNFVHSCTTVVLPAIFCCVLWGSIAPVLKLSYNLFQISSQELPKLTVFAGVRYLLCGMIGIGFGAVKNKALPRPKKTSWGMILKLALVQTFLQQLSFYISMAHISGINGSILGCLNNFFSIFIASLVFHQERLTFRKLFGCVLGFLGVITINLNEGSFSSQITWVGEGAMLAACAFCGASYAMIKEYTVKEDALILTAYQFLAGGGMLALTGLLLGGTMPVADWRGYLLFGYMAVMPITAFTIWGILLKSCSVSRLSVFGFINPITGVMLSALLLKEAGSISPIQCAIALLLVSLGICIVNIEKREKLESS